MVMNLDEFKRSEAADTPHCLLIGHPVSHSLSPVMHNTASRYHGLTLRYHALDVEQQDLASLPPVFNGKKFNGANVTIPYKQQIGSFVDHIGEAADEIGAVNTIYKKADGRLWGENTDAYGFSVALEEFRDDLNAERAIIFGTGGASRAVVYALGKLGMQELVMVSRRPGRFDGNEWPFPVKLVDYNSWSAYGEEAVLIVNTTPLGMTPEVQSSPVREGEKMVLEGTICYDIVYKPRMTRFLQLADEVDARLIGGLDMLIHQGSKSFEYWTGYTFPVEEIKKKLEDVL